MEGNDRGGNFECTNLIFLVFPRWSFVRQARHMVGPAFPRIPPLFAARPQYMQGSYRSFVPVIVLNCPVRFFFILVPYCLIVPSEDELEFPQDTVHRKINSTVRNV